MLDIFQSLDTTASGNGGTYFISISDAYVLDRNLSLPNTTDEWTIESNEDQAGVIFKKTSETYRGHGFPYPGGNSLTWRITEYSSQYSKCVKM